MGRHPSRDKVRVTRQIFFLFSWSRDGSLPEEDFPLWPTRRIGFHSKFPWHVWSRTGSVKGLDILRLPSRDLTYLVFPSERPVRSRFVFLPRFLLPWPLPSLLSFLGTFYLPLIPPVQNLFPRFRVPPPQ